ncbi:hypothetical protein FAM18119_01074 [Lacticaseibacillus paracasei]|nr:hypothetical protein FAM18119_01074 [Lacticaseibacillus paracasei]
MKKFWKTLLSALIIAISFGAFSTANQVDARVKFTRNAIFTRMSQKMLNQVCYRLLRRSIKMAP